MLDAETVFRLDENAMRLAAAREAVQKVGFLRTEAEEIIFHLLDPKFAGHHPRELCTAYRKDGEQVTADDLKDLGLRSNAFLSRKAFAELKIRGRAHALTAHETTLLRAWFTLTRWRNVSSMRAEAVPEFEDDYRYDVNAGSCPVCTRLDGQLTKGNEAHIFPPPSCSCQTANYILKPHIDFLKGL